MNGNDNRQNDRRYENYTRTDQLRTTQANTEAGMNRTQTGRTSVTTTSIKRKKKLRIRPTKEGLIALGELFLILLAIIFVIFLVVKGIKGSRTPDETTDSTTTEAPVTTEVKKPAWNAGYISLAVATSGKKEGNLILVNNETEYSFPSKMMSKLTELYGKTDGLFVMGRYKDESRTGVYLNAGIVSPLKKLCEALTAANQDTLGPYTDKDGATVTDKIMISSGYRSRDYQQGLYDEADDKSFLAKAGYSEHHTGLAFDIKIFTATGATIDLRAGEYEWITENCHKYGFIRRYQAEKLGITGISNEEWHFRFVDVPHAYAIKEAGICLEEYIEMLRKQHNCTENTPYEVSTDIGDFLVYYVPADSADMTYITVPQGAKLVSGSFAAEQSITSGMYTVSGTNEGGFIVTIAK